MRFKYWEFEDEPLKEKLKNPSIKEIASVFFGNETKAYRFARAMNLVKEKKRLQLKDCPKDLPLSTWKRYLDYGVRIGLLKHEDNAYEFSERFLRAFNNFTRYIKAWIESRNVEDLTLLFPNAKKEKQTKRGGKKSSEVSNV